MATPEEDATGGNPVANLNGNKRGACDRCRGQKLRCLREDQSQDLACVRCFKAGATCSFGMPKRAGRPPGSNTNSSRQRRGNGSGKSKQAGKASGPTVNTSGQVDSKADGRLDQRKTGKWDRGKPLIENTANEMSEGKTEDTTMANVLRPSSMDDTASILDKVNLDFPMFSESSTANLPWPDEELAPFCYKNAGDTSSLEPFSPKHSWTSHYYQPVDIRIPPASRFDSDGQSRDVGASVYGINAQMYSTNAQMFGALDEGMDLDLPGKNALATWIKSTNTPVGPVRDKDKERVHTSANSSMSLAATSARLKDCTENEAGTKMDENLPSVREIQHRRMQELSELAMDLYAQLAASDPENQQPTSSATTTLFQHQLVGSVLKSSSTFLTLLTSFSASATPSSFSPLPLPPSFINQNASTYESSDNGPSPSTSIVDYDDPTMDDESVQHSHPKPPPTSLDDSKLPAPTDMTTVFQLLTCYIRIIRLYSIMYSHILDYTLAFLPNNTSISQHVDSVPPVFPGLQVGVVSLDEFGTFQVMLLLQISVHVLGEIELALGLPEEYRVGKSKGGRGGGGVLDASVSRSFVNCLMREEAWRGKRVECMREQLRHLKRVLKGATLLED